MCSCSSRRHLRPAAVSIAGRAGSRPRIVARRLSDQKLRSSRDFTGRDHGRPSPIHSGSSNPNRALGSASRHALSSGCGRPSMWIVARRTPVTVTPSAADSSASAVTAPARSAAPAPPTPAPQPPERPPAACSASGAGPGHPARCLVVHEPLSGLAVAHRPPAGGVRVPPLHRHGQARLRHGVPSR